MIRRALLSLSILVILVGGAGCGPDHPDRPSSNLTINIERDDPAEGGEHFVVTSSFEQTLTVRLGEHETWRVNLTANGPCDAQKLEVRSRKTNKVVESQAFKMSEGETCYNALDSSVAWREFSELPVRTSDLSVDLSAGEYYVAYDNNKLPVTIKILDKPGEYAIIG